MVMIILKYAVNDWLSFADSEYGLGVFSKARLGLMNKRLIAILALDKMKWTTAIKVKP